MSAFEISVLKKHLNTKYIKLFTKIAKKKDFIKSQYKLARYSNSAFRLKPSGMMAAANLHV